MADIKKTDNTKCWWGCGAPWTVTHCRWERKTAQPRAATVQQFLTMWPRNPTPKEMKTHVHTKICAQMFRVAVFMIAHNLGCLETTQTPVNGRMDKCTVLCRNNGVTISRKRKWLPSATMGLNLKRVMLRGNEATHCIVSFMWPLKRQHYRHRQEPRVRWRQVPRRDPRRCCRWWRWSVTWLGQWLHKCTHWS